LMDLFRSEAESHTATLSAGLLALEQGGASAPSTIEPMMRAAHSLKGAARIVGLEPAVRVAHIMEGCFVAVQGGRRRPGPPQIDVLLQGLDLLTRIAQVPEDQVTAWSAGNEPEVEAMVAEIRSILSGEVTATAPAQQPRPTPPPPGEEAVAVEP